MRRNLLWLVLILTGTALLGRFASVPPAAAPGESWALEAEGGKRLLLQLAVEPRRDRHGVAWTGRLQNERGHWEPVDHVHVTPGTRSTRMEFRRNGSSWFRCEVKHGHILGTYSDHTSSVERPEEYPHPVEGWHIAAR